MPLYKLNHKYPLINSQMILLGHNLSKPDGHNVFETLLVILNFFSIYETKRCFYVPQNAVKCVHFAISLQVSTVIWYTIFVLFEENKASTCGVYTMGCR